MNWTILHQPYPFKNSLKKEVVTSLAFGAFVFIFLRVLQPFGIGNWHSETKTLELLGYGLVTIFCLFSNYLVCRTLLPNWYCYKTWTVGKNILFTLWVFFTIGCGNLLYSVYQGYLELNLKGFLFYQGLTVVVGLFPVVISTLIIYTQRLTIMVKEAQNLNDSLHIAEAREIQVIEIPSQNKSEELKFELDELLAIRAVENYVEVYLLRENAVFNMILRNTLKNAAASLSSISSVQKCHRSFIVNLSKVTCFKGNAQGLKLQLEGTNELEIPVSRAYVAEIKLKLLQL